MSRPRIAKRRPENQLSRVFALMKDAAWREPVEMEDATGDEWASISARLRDLRKKQFGEHTVDRDHVGFGLFRYRVVVNRSKRK